MSRKIIGVTVGTQLPKPNFKQTDPTKGDYIKNKPDFEGLKSEVSTLSGLVGDTSVSTQITDAMSAKADKDHTHTQTYKGTFLASGWIGNAPYTQTITVSGVLSTDYPFVDIDLSNVSNSSSVIESWRLVGRCTVSANNTVIAYCYEEKPIVDIPIILKVVR